MSWINEMTEQRLMRIGVVLLLTLGLFPRVSAGQPIDSPAPKLLVVLVVDQMRADYVEEYGHQWTAGLRRLLDDGASFSKAAYPYRSTVTCAGHATIATGRFPSAHGLIENSWWDRATAQRTSCTTDDAYTPISYGGLAREHHSPHTLRQPTIADQLREQTGGASIVVSLSLKARSAITLAGQHGQSVVWLDGANTWATSTAFTDTPVPAVGRYVDQHPIASDIDRPWIRVLPAHLYEHDDDGPFENPPPGWTRTFPHPMNAGSGPDDSFFDRWRASPLSDAYLTDMAIAMVDAFEMGSGEVTDYLALGLSATDHVGHRFGPHSHEVQDVLAQLDVTIGRLLEALDARLGLDRYVVALSADHGVGPIPERSLAQGTDAGRFQGRELLSALETHLGDHLGRRDSVSALVNGNLYFAPRVYSTLQNQPMVLESTLDLIRTTPGVAQVYRSDELASLGSTGDSIAHASTLSYFEERSGDLIIVLKPYWIPDGSTATHGSPYEYDTRVPVVLFGTGINSGTYSTPATPADIAPTLSALVGFSMPETDGRILEEALKSR